jgi:SAM-dependent methyltransferase
VLDGDARVSYVTDDVMGAVLLQCYRATDSSEPPYLVVERDDFYVAPSEGPSLYYFRDFPEWPWTNKKAMKYVRGKVLDIGCGAGRVGLYLQSHGFDVVSIDKSSGAVAVSKDRGLRNVELCSLETVDRLAPARFDTVTLMCNCFGLLQSLPIAKAVLEKIATITSENALIIAETNDPHATSDPDHVSYLKRNVNLRRMPGQARIRLRHRAMVSEWFDDLSVSRIEMNSVLEGTAWRVRQIITKQNGSPYYVALIEKRPVN